MTSCLTDQSSFPESLTVGLSRPTVYSVLRVGRVKPARRPDIAIRCLRLTIALVA